MPTILLKKSDTPGSVPGTANLTNLAGGVEVAVNTADKRMFSMTSASAVIELGTNPSSLTCADASFTVARITSLTISSLSLTNATFASATITNLTSTSATISSALTLSGGTANGVLYLNGSKVATSGSALVFDGTNLGLGVTPSAWFSTFKAFQFGANGSSVFGRSENNTAAIASNAFVNSSGNFTYINTNTASYYQQLNGQHQFYTAPSGTAGNTISFTQAMTLDASGNLGVGTTSPAGADGKAIAVYNGSGAARLALKNNSTGDASGDGFQLAVSGTTAYIEQRENDALVITTNNTERARITADGEVYIAGTTDQGAYNLQVNGTGVWGAGAYVNGSDARLKDNIQSLDSGLDVVKAIRPVTFQYKPEYSKDQSVQPGFIAQELQEAMAGKPYLEGVVQAGPNHLNVAYQNIIPILVKAIQELEAKVAALEAK